MQHSQWLTLQAEGEQILMALRALDYQCIKSTQSLLWTIRKGEIFYRLTWLSSPINEWSLLPIDGTKRRAKLLSQILAVVEIYRESSGSEILPSTESEAEGKAICASFAAPSDRLLQKNYPWMIVQLMPNAQPYVVGRFSNRGEAEHHQRFLRRFIPHAEFEVVFEMD